MKIITIKLITHEEVLGEVEKETLDTITLKNPVAISIVRGKDGSPNVGFSPFPLHAEQKSEFTIDIDKRHIVYSYEPAEDFKSNYNQLFGSGIILPKQQSIITG
jgi:hypothetical protein